MYDHIFAFIESDLYTMHLEEVLSQPDRLHFMEAMKKIYNITSTKDTGK